MLTSGPDIIPITSKTWLIISNQIAICFVEIRPTLSNMLQQTSIFYNVSQYLVYSEMSFGLFWEMKVYYHAELDS